MTKIKRILPYTKQLVFFALYDVLDGEKSEYKVEKEAAKITADVKVYDNISGFAFHIGENPPATELTVTVERPSDGLSLQGEKRAADYLADRVAQFLENELKINALLKAKHGGQIG